MGEHARIDRWLFKKRKKFHAALRPGADARSLDALENDLPAVIPGARLPDGFRALDRWRDGQPPDLYEGFAYNRSLLSLEAIRAARSTLNELLDAGDFEQPGWWSKSRVPFLGGDAVVEVQGVRLAGGASQGVFAGDRAAVNEEDDVSIHRAKPRAKTKAKAQTKRKPRGKAKPRAR